MTAGPTYTPIATVVLSTSGGFDFTSIPATYTDLYIDISCRTSNASLYDQLLWSFNGSSASFSLRILQTTGAASAAYSGSNNEFGIINGNTSTSNTFSSTKIYIPNYLSANNKSFFLDTITENNSTTAYMQLDGILWSNTAAINSITISGSNASFLQYSTAYLYGIKNS
jgi:hypothetical protein